MRIKHQVAINATETAKAKLTFEIEAQNQGVAIKEYHTDNGIFSASEFMEELLKKQQKINFSGAGASHQNGSAESAIKTVVTMARTMLMHAVLRCPEDTLSTDLWPMAGIILYGYTIGSLIFSLDSPLLKYGQDQGLSSVRNS